MFKINNAPKPYIGMQGPFNKPEKSIFLFNIEI